MTGISGVLFLLYSMTPLDHQLLHLLDVNHVATYFTESCSAIECDFQRPAVLPEASVPTVPLNEETISLKEVQQSVMKSRMSSSPSPVDQIPYIVFKKCPCLHAALLNFFEECWRSDCVPKLWKIGVVKLLPKTTACEDPENPCSKLLSNCFDFLYFKTLYFDPETKTRGFHAQ